MMNRNLSNIIKSLFLFLTISFLVITNSFITNAQSKSKTTNDSTFIKLEGTQWAWTSPRDTGFGSLLCSFKFEAQQKAIHQCVFVKGDRLQLGIDNDMLLFYATTTTKINLLPAAIGMSPPRNGKYTQNGNSTTVEFSKDDIMNLTLDKNTVLLINKNIKDPWEMSKVTTLTKRPITQTMQKLLRKMLA